MSKKRTELPPGPFYRYADQITVGSMVNVLLIQLFFFYGIPQHILFIFLIQNFRTISDQGNQILCLCISLHLRQEIFQVHFQIEGRFQMTVTAFIVHRDRITDPPFIISGVTVVIRIGINPVFFFCILLQFPLLQLLFQIVRIHGTVTASEKASVCHLQNGPLQISTQIVIKHQPFCHLVILALPAEFIPFDVLFQKVLQLFIHQNTLCKPAVILRLKCNLAANLHQTVFHLLHSLFSHHLITI